jgi:hypothetical protein
MLKAKDFTIKVEDEADFEQFMQKLLSKRYD